MDQAIRAAYAASVVARQPLSQRAMAERFGLSRHRVSQLITNATVKSNGHMAVGRKGSMTMNWHAEIARSYLTLWLPQWYEQIDARTGSSPL